MMLTSENDKEKRKRRNYNESLLDILTNRSMFARFHWLAELGLCSVERTKSVNTLYGC